MRTFDPIDVPLSGTTLVEASAGTGKTYAITTLVLRLVLEAGLSVDEVLVVTFTEAAASELRDRVRARLQAAVAAFEQPDGAEEQLARLVARRVATHEADARGEGPPGPGGSIARDVARLRTAIRAFDEAPISTIHGFCHRVLADRAFESGVPVDTELVIDDEPMLDEAVRDFWAKELYSADPRFVRHLHKRGLTPSKLVSLARVATRHRGAQLVPGRVPASSGVDMDAYEAAFTEARKMWRAERAAITTLFQEFEHLHRGKYSPAEVVRVLQAVDAFFREEEPGTDLSCYGMEKLRPDALLEATHKAYKRAGGKPPQHPFFERIEALSEAMAPLVADHARRELALRVRFVRWLRRELPRRKAAAGVWSFDDLLQRMEDALRGRGGRALASTIRSRYRAALIDEFQDTDPTQYAIFHAIYGNTDRPLFLIGDPKQAIYGFRGADIYAYIDAARAAGERRYTMEVNWRSDPALVDAVGQLFDVRQPFMIEEITYPPVRGRPREHSGIEVGGTPLPAFEVWRQPGETAQTKRGQILVDWADRTLPGAVAADIARLLHSGATVPDPGGTGRRPLHAGDIAVLVRKNDQALMVQAALRALAIPGVVYNDASVFATREAAELARVLAAVAEPTQPTRLRAAITTELLGVTAEALEAMLRGDGEEAWASWADDFRRWHTLWVERGFVQMFRALLGSRGVQTRTLALLDGERRMTNLLHLAELLHTASRSLHLGPAGLLGWFAHERARIGDYSDAVKLRLERDDRAVQLVTIHRAKGLEYPIVYCPWLWDGTTLFADEEEFLLLHDEREGHRATLDVRLKGDRDERDADPRVRAGRREKQAENLRLLYVAVTRARHRCVVTWGPFWRSEQSPLGYLLHAPQCDDGWAWDPEQIATRIKNATDGELARWLDTRAGERWAVQGLEIGAAPAYRPELAAGPMRPPRRPTNTPGESVRVTSFSHLASSAREAPGTSSLAAGLGLDGRDHDEHALPPLGVVSGEGPRVPLADFPRGARAGEFFHAVLEHLDFTAPAPARAQVVAEHARAHGVSDSQWGHRVTQALGEVMEVAIGDGGPRLADVSRADRLDELEFMLPLAGGRRDPDAVATTRTRLAEAFARHPQGLPEAYPERLQRLGFAPLRGYLKGFIDLVFVADGRWYVLDYKSNHLGDGFADYAPSRLAHAVAEGHYVLQYHLYTLAVVRHLRRALPDFDYARDFAGAGDLFLRGMSPDAPAGNGIWLEKPPWARIEALSAALDGRADR